MKIHLTDVREKSRDFRLEETLALEGFEDRVGMGTVRVQVHVNPAGERWYLSARVEGDFPFLCDRCQAEYVDRLEGEFSLVVLSKAVRGLDQDENDEVVMLPADRAELDISEQVRECMILALPMQFLCDENCAGLDPETGTDLNVESGQEEAVDPRWGPLLELKAKMESERGSGSEERQD